MMEIIGYMKRVSWDGRVLTITPTNKASAVALLGPQLVDGSRDPNDWVVRLSEWDDVQLKRANPVINGALTIHSGGVKYLVHFRRKSNADFERLADALSGDDQGGDSAHRDLGRVSEA